MSYENDRLDCSPRSDFTLPQGRSFDSLSGFPGGYPTRWVRNVSAIFHNLIHSISGREEAAIDAVSSIVECSDFEAQQLVLMTYVLSFSIQQLQFSPSNSSFSVHSPTKRAQSMSLLLPCVPF